MASITCEYRCRCCREIPFVNWDEWLEPGQYDLIDHHPSVDSLSTSAANGCALCQLFWWCLFQYSDGEALYDAHDLPQGQCYFRATMLGAGTRDECGDAPIAIKFWVGNDKRRTVIIKTETAPYSFKTQEPVQSVEVHRRLNHSLG